MGLEGAAGLGYLEKSESGNRIRKPGLRQTMVSFSSLLSVNMKFYLSQLLLFQTQRLAAFWKLQLFPPSRVVGLGAGGEVLLWVRGAEWWSLPQAILGETDFIQAFRSRYSQEQLRENSPPNLRFLAPEQNLFFFFFKGGCVSRLEEVEEEVLTSIIYGHYAPSTLTHRQSR